MVGQVGVGWPRASNPAPGAAATRESQCQPGGVHSQANQTPRTIPNPGPRFRLVERRGFEFYGFATGSCTLGLEAPGAVSSYDA